MMVRVYRSTQDPAVANGECDAVMSGSFVVVATVVTVGGVHELPPFSIVPRE